MLIDGRPAWLDPPGLALARRGFVALSIDMPTFGSRSGVTESAAAKAALWHGRTLFGQMLGEQAAALTWLAARPDVDQARIGMVGISMGATLAYFLAALDPRWRRSRICAAMPTSQRSSRPTRTTCMATT